MRAQKDISQFEARAASLPRNRQKWTVVLIRDLIKDMHDAGYTSADTGRVLHKDHTTILHHYKILGLKAHGIGLTSEQKALRDARNLELKNKRNARRELVKVSLRMYVQGSPYRDIFEETRVSRSAVNYHAKKAGVFISRRVVAAVWITRNCEKCGKEFKSRFRKARFCSRYCACGKIEGSPLKYKKRREAVAV